MQVLRLCALLSAVAAADVRIEPYGAHSFRIRVAAPGGAVRDDTLTALLPGGPDPPLAQAAGATPAAAAPGSTQSNGNLQVETLPDGGRRFTRVSDGRHLLTERAYAFWAPLPSHELHQLNATFDVGSAELFGLGQHRQACYPTGGSQTPPLLHTFTAGSLVHIDLARGEGGASNTLPWLTSASPGARSD
jgi:hypothetical protein